MCEAETQIENIRVLYKEAQQDHRQLSQTIVRSIGYTIVVNAGIWAFFIKAFIDTAGANRPGQRYPEGWHLFAAALLCSLVVILWRWYTHFLDNRVANLYAELLDYESRLDPSGDSRAWTHLEQLVFKKCTEQEKGQLRSKAAIRSLVNKSKIGWRGHGTINATASVYLVLMWLNTMILGHESPALASISFICLIVFLIAFCWLLSICAQMNPSEEDIQAATIYNGEGQETAGPSKPPDDAPGEAQDDDGGSETQS